MAAAHTALVSEESEGTVVRFDGKVSLPPGPVLVRQDEKSGVVTLSPVAAKLANPWVEFFEAMDAVPRDENWDQFVRIMDERPMNEPHMERDLFPEHE